MRDRLIHLALLTLHETVEEARRNPVKGTVGLRLALAYLFSVSDRKDRRAFDEFWRLVTGIEVYSDQQQDYIRGTYACTNLQNICQSVGVSYVAFAGKMRDAASFTGRE